MPCTRTGIPLRFIPAGEGHVRTGEEGGRFHHEEHEGTRRMMEFDELSNRVIGCAIEVHRELGPGLLESTYEQCLAHELKINGIAFCLQHPQPVAYSRTK